MVQMDSKLVEIVASALNCDSSTLSENSGLGKHYRWDSLGHIAIMGALENHYGLEISSDNVEKLTSLKGIQSAIESARLK